jgi:hypothetical protein
MRRAHAIPVFVTALLLMAAQAAAEPTTYGDRLDIAEMMEQAQKRWNFDDQDAVLLLERARFTWEEDGRLREERHRVVWIDSEYAIETFADLRVPWDSDRQSLTVSALRVWRDERWVEARPTAVVETTPFELRDAPDYTGIRETMLLHDGIEIPCILECNYVIEDTQPFRAGMEGQWIFGHLVPALQSWVILEAPSGVNLAVHASEGVVEPDHPVPGGSRPGYSVRSYRMEMVGGAPLPATPDPAGYLPHVQWSSFPNWEELGRVIEAAFAGNLGLDPALGDSLSALLKDASSDLDRVHRITDFVERSQRRIGYDPQLFLYRARPASRVFDTAYGVDIDQVVLAAALFREAGFEVWPAFFSPGPGIIDQGVATLARLQAPGLWIQCPGVETYWEASSNTLLTSLAPLSGRTLWRPGRDWGPGMFILGVEEASRLMLVLDLAWDAEEKRWHGTGYYEAAGTMSPYGLMEGRKGGTRAELDRIVSGLFEGMSVEEFDPVGFGPLSVSMRLEVNASGEPDTLGRLPVVIGTPGGGLIPSLPHDVHLYLAERGAPVLLPDAIAQSVRVTLDLADLDVVRLPEPMTLENGAGRFELTVDRKDDKVTVSRTTTLIKAQFTAEEWPGLREILLAETHDSNRTILLE